MNRNVRELENYKFCVLRCNEVGSINRTLKKCYELWIWDFIGRC